MNRVLYVIDTLAVGGAERSVVALASNTKMWRAGVVTMYRGSTLASSLRGVEFADLGDECQPYAWMAVIRRLRRIVSVHRPDIIHATLFRSDIAARIVGAQLGVPVVSSLVSDSYGHARMRRLDKRSRTKMRAVLAVDLATAPLSSHFVANSESAAAAGVRDLRLNKDRITVIPRGRDLSRFRPAQVDERDSARRSLGLEEWHRITITVGRLTASKNHELIIKAFAAIRAPQDRLVVVGDGEERSKLEVLARRLDVQDSVLFLGELSDVAAVLRSADFFLFASDFEGSPGAVIESLASGLPSLLVDIPAVREIATDLSSFFFQAGDFQGLCSRWREILDAGPELLREMAMRGRIDGSRFSEAVMVERHEALYTSVVRRSQRADEKSERYDDPR